MAEGHEDAKEERRHSKQKSWLLQLIHQIPVQYYVCTAVPGPSKGESKAREITNAHALPTPHQMDELLERPRRSRTKAADSCSCVRTGPIVHGCHLELIILGVRPMIFRILSKHRCNWLKSDGIGLGSQGSTASTWRLTTNACIAGAI